MMKRFNKLCSLLLTFAVTATTVFSSEIGMISAYADDDVSAVAVEAEEEAAVATATEESVEAAIEESAVAADVTTVDEVVVEDEVDVVEGYDYEKLTDKSEDAFQMTELKVEAVSSNKLSNGTVDYYITISYKAENAPAVGVDETRFKCEIDDSSTFIDSFVGTPTKTGAVLKINANVWEGSGWLIFDDDYTSVKAAVVFNSDYIDDEYLEVNQVSENKGLLVTYYSLDDKEYINYPEHNWYYLGKDAYTAGKIADTKGNYYYTGKPIKPHVVVYDGDTKLKEGTDYTVKYKNNVKPYNKLDFSGATAGASYDVDDANQPYVEIVGKGTYANEIKGVKKFFNIVPAEIKECAYDDYAFGKYGCEYDYMVHAEGVVKAKNHVVLSGKKPKVDVTIYNVSYKYNSKKNEAKYKATATKLKEGTDYTVKYISANTFRNDLGWNAEEAWKSEKAVTTLSEAGEYIVLVAGVPEAGKLKSEAAAADYLYYIDKEHDVSTAKITVSANTKVSFNQISEANWVVDPIMIDKVTIGGKEVDKTKFAYCVYGGDCSIGKNRRIRIDTTADSEKEGYYGYAVCKTKFEIYADKNIKDLEANIYNPNTGKLIPFTNDKLELTYDDITQWDLDNHRWYLALVDKNTKKYYVQGYLNNYYVIVKNSYVVSNIDGMTLVPGFTTKTKDKDLYVGKYAIQLDGLGVDGYGGTRKLTIDVKPLEISANMISWDSKMELSTDGKSITYKPHYVDDKESKPVYGVPYRATGYYEDEFNGYTKAWGNEIKAENARNNNSYAIARPKLPNGTGIYTPGAAYDFKLVANTKGINNGGTVNGKLTYSGAIKGSVDVSFNLVTGAYKLYCPNMPVKVSADAVYSDKFKNKVTAEAYDFKIEWTFSPRYTYDVTSGYKIDKKGYLTRSYKKCKLKEGKEVTINADRYKSLELKDNVLVGKDVYAEGDNILGKYLFVTSTGSTNYTLTDDYHTCGGYKVGVDINVYKKEIEKRVNAAIAEYNKKVGREGAKAVQIGQKYDYEYEDFIEDKMLASVLKAPNDKNPDLTYNKDFSFDFSEEQFDGKKYFDYTHGVTGKTQFMAGAEDEGILVGSTPIKITIDKRKDAKVEDYKYVLSK